MPSTVEFELPDVVVVSGASSGFGEACTRRLLAGEVSVVGVDIAPVPERVHDRYRHHQGDVSAEETWEGVAEEVSDLPGSLGLVTCAAVLDVGTVVDHDVDAWRNTFDVNVLGSMLAMRCMVPAMIERGGGAIVALASVDALSAEQELVSYCASKAALYQLARTTALDFARNDIRANVLSPGPMDLGLFQRHLEAAEDPSAFRATRTRRQPNGRILDPEEVVHSALFLLSSGASGMTGAELRVDGGLTAGYEFRTADAGF